MIRVGPAGWSYPDWERRVYPRAKPRGFHPLTLLAAHLDGVELNSTFYALPRAENAARWTELVQPWPAFRFVAKLLQGFTHAPYDEARWDSDARAFRAGLAPLLRQRLLSAVLVQFPIGFQHGAHEIRRLGHVRTLFDDLPLVLEVRHHSWFTPPALDAIRGLGYSLAPGDLPSAWNHPPERHAPTGPIGYLRLHGRNAEQWFRAGAGRDDRYDYLYPPPELGALARKATSIERETSETWVVTNNHFGGQAVANALELKYLLGRRQPVPAWPEIVAAFPHLAGITRVAGQGGLFGGVGQFRSDP